jgi:hypothetical protein
MLRPVHCDQRVLHAPEDNCQVCNGHPEWQQLREMWGINFTGHRDPDKLPCPAEVERPLRSINLWYGNVPLTPELEAFRVQREKDIEELTDKYRRQYWGVLDE